MQIKQSVVPGMLHPPLSSIQSPLVTGPLAGGAEGVLEALVQSFDTDPAAALTAFAPLKMPALLRRSLLVALQAAVKVTLSPACLAARIPCAWHILQLTDQVAKSCVCSVPAVLPATTFDMLGFDLCC